MATNRSMRFGKQQIRFSLWPVITYLGEIPEELSLMGPEFVKAYYDETTESLKQAAESSGKILLAGGLKFAGDEDHINMTEATYMIHNVVDLGDTFPELSDIVTELDMSTDSVSPLFPQAMRIALNIKILVNAAFLTNEDVLHLTTFRFDGEEFPLLVLERIHIGENGDPTKPPFDLIGLLRKWGYPIWRYSRWDESLGCFYIRIGDPNQVDDHFTIPEDAPRTMLDYLFEQEGKDLDPALVTLIAETVQEGLSMKDLTKPNTILIDNNIRTTSSAKTIHHHSPAHRDNLH